MTKFPKLSFLLVLLMCGLAYAGQPISINPNVTLDFTDCSSSGSSAQLLHGGDYVLTVTDEDVWLCWAATCGSGGRRWPVGTVINLHFGGGSGNDTQLSCRSAGSTGDANFTAGG